MMGSGSGNRHSPAFLHVSREEGTLNSPHYRGEKPHSGQKTSSFSFCDLICTFPQEERLTQLVRIQDIQRAEFLSALVPECMRCAICS